MWFVASCCTLHAALHRLVQPTICHIGIHMLQAFAKSRQYPQLKDAACRIIRNLSRHPKNRTLIYKTELSLKADEFYDDILDALKSADTAIQHEEAGDCT